MLKLYSDRRFIKAGARHTVMLYPFWGKPAEDPTAPLTGRFDRYMEVGDTLFTMSTIQEADLAVVPAPWEDVMRDDESRRLAHAFIGHAREHGKPIALFCINDSSDPIPVDDALIFRTSFYRSRRRRLEFAQPAWIEDFVAKYLDGQLVIRQKQPRPSVGFCGYAGPLGPAKALTPIRLPVGRRLKRMLTDVVDTMGLRKTHAVRGRALSVLARSKLVDTRFVIRNDFLGPTVINEKSGNAAAARHIRQEYVDNIVNADYTLCARGMGNYSIRLIETLACGRIPIFIDTDSPLPYDFMVDWHRYVVWVKERDLEHIDEVLAEHHRSLSPADFVERQYR
jgi:hypothetical protein